MAHESVFAKALPKVGHANRHTQNGEIESGGTDPDDPVSQADLEEGEILDSGQEDSDDQQAGGNCAASGPAGPAAAQGLMHKGPPLPPQGPQGLHPPFPKLEKRKRKKRKKEADGEPKQKRAHYVDHDRVVDDTVWFPPESNVPLGHHPGGGGPHLGHHGGRGGHHPHMQQLPHHPHPQHHGGPMPPRDFGSPGPYDDGFMQSPRGRDSPDGGGPGGLDCPQEGMGGPPHQGFPQGGGRGGHRGGRGGKPHPMDMRRGPPKKKRRKKSMGGMGARGNKRGGGGGGDAPKSRSICKFYLDSKCVKGTECPFSHDAPQARKRDMCKFYLSGYCARGEHCSFMHQEFPCKFFHTGAKCFADASCRFSHQPLTEETQRLLGRVQDNNGGPPDRGDGVMMGPPEDRGDQCDPQERSNDADRGETSPRGDSGEFMGPPLHMLKRPSLLGSPPRHVKEAAESWRMQFLGGPPGAGPQGVPFVQQGPAMMSPPRGGPMGSLQGFPPRPSFYMDTLQCSPVRGMPMAGSTPPHGGHPGMGPNPLCLDEGFGQGPMPIGAGPGPHPAGLCSPDISSPPLQDQGPSFVGEPRSMGPDGMPQLGVFFDPSQDQPMSPPPSQQQPQQQQQQQQPQQQPHQQPQQQAIPGLTLTEFSSSRLSPPPQQTTIPGLDLVDQTSAKSPSPRQGDEADGGRDREGSDDEMWQPSERRGLPPNLPWRQRQLFLRIQQQQKEQRAAEEAAAPAASPEAPSHPVEAEMEEQGPKKAEVREEEKKPVVAAVVDAGSSDDDEDYDDDQPLTAVLKKLQEQAVKSIAPAKSSGGTTAPALLPTPSAIVAPSPGTINFAEMMSRIEQQVPSQSQTNFWKHLFSSVPAATTPAVDTAPVPTPPTSRDPRRARAETQLPKPAAEAPQSSRDPRLRDKLPLPPTPKPEIAFVESKDGDAPYRLVSILRALPNYDDVARGGSLPHSKLRSDPRFAKYCVNLPPEAPKPATVVAKPTVAKPSISELPLPPPPPPPPKPAGVNRRDPRVARHLEQQHVAPDNKAAVVPEPQKSSATVPEVQQHQPQQQQQLPLPKMDPRKAAAMAAGSAKANGGTALPPVVRIDPRLARRLEQMQQKQQQQATEPSSHLVVKKDEEMEVSTEPVDAKPPPPPPKRDPRQKSRTVRNPRAGLAARKNRMDYASPLSSYESEGDRPSGYSSYQRRPQPRPPVPPALVEPPPASTVSLPVVLPSPMVPALPLASQAMPPPSPAIISDALLCDADQAIKSLKDVFKTKDPTASPFC
ncbi:unnamed protein product [Ixodes hexagonus]